MQSRIKGWIMKNIKKAASVVLVGSLLALGACQTTETSSSAAGAKLDMSSLSVGAKTIATAALGNMGAIKSACQAGRDGVKKLITSTTTELMQSGENLKPSTDGPEAGEFIGKHCRDLLSA
jgi:hypothetical protein